MIKELKEENVLTLIKNAYIYRNDRRAFSPLEILCDGGRITAMAEKIENIPTGTLVFDANGMAVFPGLIDVHTHGRSGADFVSANEEELSIMARDYALHGVTTVMPALASAPLEQMADSAKRISDFVPTANQAEFCGVHLEGRYLNSKKRGAHAENMLAPLSADELEKFAFLDVLHVSAAFELDTDGSFAKKAKEIGATLGLGHTMATYSEAKMAESRGVNAYTHLFNAMPPLHHRDGGAVAACLMGRAYAELICDGIHIAPEMVALAYRCKGAEATTLISDSMEATGCADGEYSIAGNPITVKDGKALTHDGALAGSTLTLDDAVQNLVSFCSISLTDAIISATETPAKQMDVFNDCGSLDVGKKADMLFCGMDDVAKNIFKIKKIMLRGNFIN